MCILPRLSMLTRPRIAGNALTVALCILGTAAAQEREDWPSYNNTATGERFSSLSQINVGNAGELRKLCTYDTHQTVNFQSGLIEVRDVIYGATEMDTFAIDSSTCRQKWRVHESYTPALGTDTNRGVAHLDGRIFRGTQDARVLAYDARTGARLWATQLGDPDHAEVIPGAPFAWKGMVFVGVAGGDNKGVKGRVYALDAVSGRVLWTFYTVPRNQEEGPELGWFNPPGAPITGGGTWSTISLDPSTGTLYVPSGNASPVFDKSLRPGVNSFTSSVIKLDARSGSYRGHVAVTPEDFHDYDESSAPVILTSRAGKRILAVAPKDGFLHGFDLVSGRELYKTPVSRIENADVPLSADPLHFCPGTSGGSEWNGPAYDSTNNLVITGSVQWCVTLALQPSEATLAQPDWKPWTGSADHENLYGKLDPVAKRSGWIYGTDADTGSVVWRFQTPGPVVGGVTATAGGLVFVGDIDGNQYALDARSGQPIWRQQLGGAIGGGVITYRQHGIQRIAVAVGLTSPAWQTQPTTAKVVILAIPGSRAEHD